ncbi:MAG: GTPase, partial [Candidatus Kapaibacteriota bacterium]
MEKRTRVLILGAAGRDFHNFNVFFKNKEEYEVVGFTAAQIPNIDGRLYPPSLAGELYPKGIPIYAEDDLEELIQKYNIDECVLSYSDLSYEYVMHLGSRVIKA